MSIKDFAGKIKPLFSALQSWFHRLKDNFKIKEDTFIAVLITLVGLASFGLGKLSVLEAQKTPISINNNESAALNAVPSNIQNTASLAPTTTAGKGIVFSSKSGTKYYYPWCSGAKRVADANRVWFPSIAAAKAAGLAPAANCPGLQ